jgi:hypothetical protein
VSLAIVSSGIPSTELVVCITDLEEVFEIMISLNIHAIILKSGVPVENQLEYSKFSVSTYDFTDNRSITLERHCGGLIEGLYH